MTLWHAGRRIDFGKPIDAHFDTQIMNGKYLITTFLSEGYIYYSVQYWKGPDTLHTIPVKLRDKKFDYPKTIQNWVYLRDNFLQFSITNGDAIEYFYIDPMELAEIKELEGEEKPP